MTRNKLKKSELLKEMYDISADREDHYNPKPYKEKAFELKEVLKSEVFGTFRADENNVKGNNLCLRNIICAKNCLFNLQEENFFDAWWEMTDVISVNMDQEYISEDELAVIYLLLEAFCESFKDIDD